MFKPANFDENGLSGKQSPIPYHSMDVKRD